MSISRNAPCPCGSGKKHKHCCGRESDAVASPAPRTLFTQAQRAHGEGRLAEAQKLYAAILEKAPHDADALHYQGMIAYQTGRLEQARVLVERSLALRPADADFWANMGVICEAGGDLPGAEQAYRKVLQRAPANGLAWFNLGNVLLQRDRIEEALQAFRQTTVLLKTDWRGWMNLGVALLKRDLEGDAQEAVECFDRVVRLSPGNPDGFNSLAVGLGRLRRLDEALVAVNKAIELNPVHADAWMNLARIHLERDDVESALEIYQQAIRFAPNAELFYKGMGDGLRMLGKFDTARAFFERAYAVNPKDLGALSQLLTDQKFASADDALLQRACASIDDSEDGDEGVVDLCFTLGKIFDRLDQFDAAFAYYARGNRIRRQAYPFDREAHRLAIDSLIEKFNADYIAGLRKFGNPSERPIVIVGMPRSGTTLTEQIIAAHPRVVGGGERLFWSDAGQQLQRGKWNLDEDGIRAIAQAYLDDLNRVPGADTADRVADKLPANFLRAGLIHAVFPNARIIHVRRHPVDNCLSIFFQNFTGHHAYSFDLDDLAFYRMEYERLMAHWARVLPAERYMEFNYEDLVQDQEGVSRRLIKFCGLEWNDACLRYYENDQAIKTFSMWQVRQKIYSSSVERWRNYEKHIGSLMRLLPGAATPGGGG